VTLLTLFPPRGPEVSPDQEGENLFDLPPRTISFSGAQGICACHRLASSGGECGAPQPRECSRQTPAGFERIDGGRNPDSAGFRLQSS
jgi:hypothetical protein